MTTVPTDRDGPVVITGGAGFIGSNLADRLAAEGRTVVVLDSLERRGVEANLAWLKSRHGPRVRSLVADVRDAEAVARAVNDAAAVFHFAAQVAVTTSLVQPRLDFDVNIGGTLNVLEALRRAQDPAPCIFASTNKVYGDLADVPLQLEEGAWQPSSAALRGAGIDERRPLDFHTPYGCSKGAADQYVLDYARSFGLHTAVLRMSCIYGPRQMGTEDQGWVAHFLIRMLERRAITLYGDGCQVRDVLDVSDAVAAYLGVWRNIGRLSGRAFNLGGGPENAVSLHQLLAHAGEMIGTSAEVQHEPWRAGDQRWFVADARELRQALGLGAPVAWRDGVEALASWLGESRGGMRPRKLTRSQGAPAVRL